MNKRAAILLLLALIFVVVPLASQQKIDLIVLLDSSKSMFAYYYDVIDYVLSGTVREYLRFGDTFHLINFADSTTVEMMQPLQTEQDLKSVIARLYLLYPLGRNTDLVTALRNVYSYVETLPKTSTKIIILISDGMHSPAPGTPYAAMDVIGVTKEINAAASRIKESGWILKIVRIPFDGKDTTDNPGSIVTVVPGSTGASPNPVAGSEATPTSPGSGNYLDQVAKASGADVTDFDPAHSETVKNATVGFPTLKIPADLGQQGYSFKFNAELYNASESEITFSLISLFLPDGTDILSRATKVSLASGTSGTIPLRVKLPTNMEAGEKTLTLEPRFADGIRINPARSTTRIILKRDLLTAVTGNFMYLILIILLALILFISVLLILRYIAQIDKKTETPIVEAVIDSTAVAGHHKDAKQLLAASIQTRHTPGTTPTSIIRHTPNAVQLLAAEKYSHQDIAASVNLLADTSAENSKSHTSRRLSILESWQHKTSSRIALPPREKAQLRGTGYHVSNHHYEMHIVKPGAQRIILQVRGQNPNIGSRNIHIMHAGNKKSIGGRGSDFLVFLLPFPRNFAHVYYDGVNVTIVPAIEQCFPDFEGIIENCMDKELRILNAHNKELFITFLRYVPPIEMINKLLHSIETPGLLSLIPSGTSIDEPESHHTTVGL
jgi:hypothetical protein